MHPDDSFPLCVNIYPECWDSNQIGFVQWGFLAPAVTVRLKSTIVIIVNGFPLRAFSSKVK